MEDVRLKILRHIREVAKTSPEDVGCQLAVIAIDQWERTLELQAAVSALVDEVRGLSMACERPEGWWDE